MYDELFRVVGFWLGTLFLFIVPPFLLGILALIWIWIMNFILVIKCMIYRLDDSNFKIRFLIIVLIFIQILLVAAFYEVIKY